MKFQRTLHRKLWLWLADNPEMEKEDWSEWTTRESVDSHCFACDYNYDRFKVDDQCDCSGCPLVWTKNEDEEIACHTGGLSINGKFPQAKLALTLREL